jgi:MarR family transcriptional regulator, organic hydroperoxide resistance regulator
MKLLHIQFGGTTCNIAVMGAGKLRLYSLLQRAAHDLKKSTDRALMHAADLTTAQSAVLVIIAERGPIKQKDVAQALGLNESAMVAMVNRLLQLDYLMRVRDANDQRQWLLSPSVKGTKALQLAAEPFNAINARLDALLSDEQGLELAERLRAIIKEFETR